MRWAWSIIYDREKKKSIRMKIGRGILVIIYIVKKWIAASRFGRKGLNGWNMKNFNPLIRFLFGYYAIH